MSNDDTGIISKEGFLQVKLYGQPKWHRRYCIIDWDKALLFIATKTDRQYGDYIKLLPSISIVDADIPSDYTIEIVADNQSHFLLTESKKEHDCWLISLKRTAYSRFGGGIFGQTLEDTYRYAIDKTSLVPVIVRQCCEFLLEHGTTFVGLFRVPGKQSLIRELRDRYDRCQIVELDSSHSPSTITSLLKMYLQSLPEPIVPMKHFDDFLEIGSRLKYNQTSDLVNLKHLIESKLSNINYALLAYLCLFIRKLTQYAEETKMDTENFAIAFGSNLIRASEELDIHMIKGHSYNLIPLIKTLIDQSEYLFPSNSNGLCEEQHESCEEQHESCEEQQNDSGEKHNESIRKSSGFSSFSSLLSSSDHQLLGRTRSSSLPSIPYTSSLIDSANFSFDGRSDDHIIQYRSKSVIEKVAIYESNSPQSSTTCIQGDSSINEEKDENDVEIRLTKSETIEYQEATNRQSITKEQKRKSAIPWQFGSKSNVCSSSTRKTSKKTFADKVGKSISSFKLSMSKAFIPHLSSTDTISRSNTIDVSSFRSSRQPDQRRSVDLNLSNNYLKILHNEICVLKGIIDKKETIIKTSEEERLRYEKENFELKQQIEQLQIENSQLKSLYQADN